MTPTSALRTTDPREWQRRSWVLVWAVATPYWFFMLATRMLGFNLATALDPRIIIAPPHLRVLQHLLLMPLLVLFLRSALLIGWRESQKLRALLLHAGMAVFFALLARPVLVVLVAMQRGEVELLDELFRSIIGPSFSLVLWSSSGADFLLSYLGALLLVFAAQYCMNLREQLHRAAALESEWVRGRLQSLQQRAHPQFVINTLQDAVAAIPQAPVQATNLLARLIVLLRRSLTLNGDDLVPVTDEIESARQYLDIQSQRFPQRIEYTFEIDAAAQSSLIPGLTLQPLLEDVLLRSLRQPGNQLVVAVVVTLQAAGVDITVRSNASVTSNLVVPESAAIAATRERLQRLFGDRQGLLLDDDGSATISARLRIPWVDIGAHAAPT
jgi:hypothetical protein